MKRMIELASKYERYDYRRVMAQLRTEGWQADRVCVFGRSTTITFGVTTS